MLPVDGPAFLWVMFGSWVIHDAEELVVTPRWLDRHEAELRARAAGSPAVERTLAAIEGDPTALAVTVGSIGVFVLAATVIGLLDPAGVGMLVYLTILGGYTLHIGIHVIQAGVLRTYVPGVLTGVLVVLPACGYLYLRLFAGGYVTRPMALVTAVVGLAVVVPTALIAHRVGRRVASTRQDAPSGNI